MRNSAAVESQLLDESAIGKSDNELLTLNDSDFDEALQKAIRINDAKREQLRTKVREMQAALNKADTMDEHLKRLAAIRQQQNDDTVLVPETLGTRQRKRRTSMAFKVRQEVYLILKRVNRPLNRTELLRELTGAGVELPAQNPLAAITKIMWNTAEFESTGGGYWLAGEPLPN